MSIFQRKDIDIVKRRGETLDLVLTFRDKTTGDPIDLTGFTPRLQIRADIAGSGAPDIDVQVGANLVFNATTAPQITVQNVALDPLAVGVYAWNLELDDAVTPRNEEPVGGNLEIVQDGVRPTS